LFFYRLYWLFWLFCLSTLESSTPGPAFPLTLAALTPDLEGFFFILDNIITSNLEYPLSLKLYKSSKNGIFQKKINFPLLLIAQIFKIFYIK